MYDVIIVGARCAGSPTAMLLAQKGYKVLLTDRATFPSDTMSTHIVWQPGVAHLKRWGLLEKVIASNCPPLGKLGFDVGDFALTGQPPPADGVGEFYMPRRKVLDKILVDAAVESGAELREGFTVQDLIRDGARVEGIRGRSKQGSVADERSRIVIGADGMRSIVARTVQAPEYNNRPALACWYYSYWSGVEIQTATFYSREGRAFGCMPTNDGLVCLVVAWTNGEFHRFREDIEGNVLKTIEQSPDLARRVREGKREEHFVGTADLPNFFRKPYGAGWALVGDAGYHRDPITAQGITDAFHGAEQLADALDEGLSGKHPLEEVLAEYEQRRNEEVMPMYEMTCQFAALEAPPPETQQLLAALRGNQADTDRFLGTITGTVSIPEFYSPENVARILAGG
jgi:flavin-dependent dehydrogenase